jgi:hypothetical protein
MGEVEGGEGDEGGKTREMLSFARPEAAGLDSAVIVHPWQSQHQSVVPERR